MSVDTYLKGKNTAVYTTFEPEDGVKILVMPKLARQAVRIDVVTRKKLIGAKLVARVQLDDNCAL